MSAIRANISNEANKESIKQGQSLKITDEKKNEGSKSCC